MNNKKTLTLNGLTLPNFIFVLISVAMIFVGAYLTNHYFDTLYPDGIGGASTLCNINDFWGCDKATQSSLATIMGMPTSIFGIIMGLIGVITGFVGNANLEKTTKTILFINLVFCAILFIYSLASLGGLCPMCTVYYVLSLAAYLMMHKYSELSFGIDMKTGAGFAALLIIPVIGFNVYLGQKTKEKASLSISYVDQFNSLKSYGDPAVESPYKIHMATKNFADAPIRISIFSDFQCPYCQKVADQVPQIINEFRDKVNIQYLFYPLDSSCNKAMKGSMHVHACHAAYLAACDKEKFAEVHDYIFEHQSEINRANIKSWTAKFGLSEKCFENKNVQDQIQQTLNAGEQYSLRSTPTIIINGKKLEGLVPFVHLKAILNSLLNKK